MILKELLSFKSPQKEEVFVRFFKTGKGEYGEGDIFLGLSVPITRKIALKYRDLPINEIQKILNNKYHECRLAALMILVHQYKHGDKNFVCHSFVRNGKIEYLSDCTHNLAGKTVDIPKFNVACE
jgi:hypothetical protein